jgi:AcrR family transcriptional regulator
MTREARVARTVNIEEHEAKRTEILNTAMGLVFTKGYDRMTIRDILDGTGISKGAFYHYFDSKEALLEAFIQQIVSATDAQLRPLAEHPDLSAQEKLRGYFDAFRSLRTENVARIVALSHVWYEDVNALVRQKVASAVRVHRAPILARIIQQGLDEGVFEVAWPEVSGHLVLSLVDGMELQHTDLLWRPDGAQDDAACAEALARVHCATMAAIECALQAPRGTLERIDAAEMRTILRAIREVKK